MTPEQPSQRKPYEIFGLTDKEAMRLRVSDVRLKEILANTHTTPHTIKLSTNTFGEFIFLTASRGTGKQRICITFYGLGYHEYRERWLYQEWFWYQSEESHVDIQSKLSEKKVNEILEKRLTEISPHFGNDVQTELGIMFEQFADLTDDDAALAEMQDLGLL